MSSWIYQSKKLLFWLYLFPLQVHAEFPLLAHWNSTTSSVLHLYVPSNSFWTCSSSAVHRQSLHRASGAGLAAFTLLRRLYKYKPHFHKTALRKASLTSLAVWWRNWDADALSKTGPTLGPRGWKPNLYSPCPVPGHSCACSFGCWQLLKTT